MLRQSFCGNRSDREVFFVSMITVFYVEEVKQATSNIVELLDDLHVQGYLTSTVKY